MYAVVVVPRESTGRSQHNGKHRIGHLPKHDNNTTTRTISMFIWQTKNLMVEYTQQIRYDMPLHRPEQWVLLGGV